jgi:spore coat protein H
VEGLDIIATECIYCDVNHSEVKEIFWKESMSTSSKIAYIKLVNGSKMIFLLSNNQRTFVDVHSVNKNKSVRDPGKTKVGWLASVISFLFVLLFWSNLFVDSLLAQPVAKPDEGTWLIEWKMNGRDYRKMKREIAHEYVFSPDSIKINGNSAPAEDLHTRGNTSLRYWRKSYAVSLKEDFMFSSEQGNIPMKHFYLISMSMDSYYYRNYLVSRCLQLIDLWPMFFHYAEVRINNRSEGMYLVMQRPKDYAIHDLGAKAIIRRFSTDRLDKASYAKNVEEPQQEAYLDAFSSIAKACTELQGPELYQALSRTLDLEKYFLWLAFNYLVSNGDYTDELFYYSLSESQEIYFGILPWDFDDILAPLPHEGSAQRDRHLGDQLIFSAEDRLDRTIATDPYLYQKYLKQADKMLDKISVENMRIILDNIQNELTTYLQDPEIVRISQHDREPVASLEVFKSKIRTTYDYLSVRHRLMRKKIAEQTVE